MRRVDSVTLLLCILLFHWSCSGVRSTGVETAPVSPIGKLRFTADFAIFRDEGDSLRVDLHLKIPHTMLFFSKGDQAFTALYEGMIAVDREGGRGVTTREFEGRVEMDSYEQAHTSKGSEFHSFHFRLNPGRYAFSVTISDRNSQRQGMIRQDVKVSSFPEQAVSISSIVFAETVDSESTSTVNLVPNPERIYGEHLPELRFCYEVYIPEGTAHQDSLRTQFEIISSNNGNRIVLEDGPTVPHREGNYALTGTSQLRGIQEEDLELVVHVVDIQGRVLAERKGTFHVYWPLVNWGDDFELSLAQLELVAPGDVVSEYKKCAPEEREPFLKTYWNSRDPVPQTEQNELLVEFEKRLRHAKRQLGGIWTDRSKVYIQNGSPQEMSRRMVRDAFGYPRPAEIWVYFDPYREFVFVEDRLVRR